MSKKKFQMYLEEEELVWLAERRRDIGVGVSEQIRRMIRAEMDKENGNENIGSIGRDLREN